MKTTCKVGIIALAAIIGFAMTACPSDSGGGSVAVTGVSIERVPHILAIGETESLGAVVSPSDADDSTVTWASDKPAVATVDSAGKVTAVAPGTAKITVTTNDGGKTASVNVTVSLIGMKWIASGTFQMGSPLGEPGRIPWEDNETRHSVTLTQGFHIGTYPVTQAQYNTVMETNPSYFSASGSGSSSVTGINTDNFPVEYITWYDAVEFCNKLSTLEGLTPVYTITGRTPETGYPITSATVTADFTKNGYRLPTEAQWEYACRAGTSTAFNWGTDTINDTQANYAASYVDDNNTVAGTDLNRTSAVGSYAPNAWGLYDMHGNVFEWCGDWYNINYGSEDATVAQSDPTGAVSGANRVLRGGAWLSLGQYARSAYRDYRNPSDWIYVIGFRLVRP